ncbi:MAG: glycosyltransferase [Longimicrobiales bacterium]|nr:glycosyltransferase [Longimicrobiales bacterium]
MNTLLDRLAAAASGARRRAVILSANPMHDTGGGQRSAQLALELVARDYAVVFVSHGRVTETVDLALCYEQPRLVEMSLDTALDPDVVSALNTFVSEPGSLVITQVPVREWTPFVLTAREKGAATVYDCIDRWDSELGWGWYQSENEAELARDSEYLVASAYELVDHIERLSGRETELLPNAFNARLFTKEALRAERPDDLPEAERIALYVGALWGSWLDWDLVKRSAQAHPRTAFVFVGDRRREGRGLPANCHFLGLKPQTDLPSYLGHADLAFLPWRVSDVTRATSPLKIYEFVAAGLPVAGPDIEPLRGIPGVRRATDEMDFVDLVGRVRRSTTTPAVATKMHRFSAANSWGARVERILEMTEHRVVEAPAVHTGATLSAVIPLYNHERWIGEAIDSVRDQTLPASELIVVDDGSLDSSRDVLEAHRFTGLRSIYQENRGAHFALNRAIALSKGDYIAVLNSDDAFEPERLEHAWGVTRATGAALLCGSVRLVGADGAGVDPAHPISRWYREARELAQTAPSFAAALKKHNVAVTTSNFFFHRALWEALGGFAAYRYTHDYDFLLRAMQLCPERVVYEDSLTDVRYRVHASNTILESQARGDEERREMFRAVAQSGRGIMSRVGRRASARAIGVAVEKNSLLSLPRYTDASVPKPALRAGIVVRSLGTGGLEEVVALLAQALPAAGVSASLLCSHEGGPIADRLTNAGVDVTIGGGRASSCAEWAKSRNLDVVSSHFAPLETVSALADTGVPVVETIQNTYAWFRDSEWQEERRRIDRLAGVVAVSEGVAEYYQRHTDRQSLRVIPNAIHPGRVASAPRAFARRRYGLSPDDVVFCSIGRVTEQKNPFGLLAGFEQAVVRSPGLLLLLVGPDDKSARVNTLKRRFPDLFSSGAVRHIGPVEDVGTVLSAADGFVSNSFYEGWSVAASEAAWSGLPLVLSETGGSAELVGEHGERGILVPNPCGSLFDVTQDTMRDPSSLAGEVNEAAVADALVGIAEAASAWKERRPGICSFARESLGPSRIAAQYAECFREVVGRGA